MGWEGNAWCAENLVPCNIVDVTDYPILGNLKAPERFTDAGLWDAFFNCAAPNDLAIRLLDFIPESLISHSASGDTLDKL